MKVGILTGPTATGKTSIALDFADKNGEIEIINADSLLVYSHMDIGTAKPTPSELAQIKHHLINIRNPDEPFTAGDFVREARTAISQIHDRGRRALVVGGTGFYLKALMFGMWDAKITDPKIRAQLDVENTEDLWKKLKQIDAPSAIRIGPNDRYRIIRALEIFMVSNVSATEFRKKHANAKPDPNFDLCVIDRPSEELKNRISVRTRKMISDGLINEVQSLRLSFPKSLALKAVGYREVINYLDDRQPDGRTPKVGLEGLMDEIELGTNQLVKRQRTWFKTQKNAKHYVLEDDKEQLLNHLASIYYDTGR